MPVAAAPQPPRPDSLHLWRPTADVIDAARGAAAEAPFSYPDVGGTRAELPEGYDHDVQRVILGEGDLAFARARKAMRAGRMFDIPWITLERVHLDLQPGSAVPFVSHQFGFYALNVCRLVYVVDEPDELAFAWGTVAGHVVAGEERFGLRKLNNGDVEFQIRKFSRLAHPLIRLAAPLARRVQRNFSRDALAAMVAASRA